MPGSGRKIIPFFLLNIESFYEGESVVDALSASEDSEKIPNSHEHGIYADKRFRDGNIFIYTEKHSVKFKDVRAAAPAKGEAADLYF